MSLARGIQSAIFHYLSCAPCTGYAYRKKRRKEAKRDRIARDREMQQRSPDDEEIYRHPDPSHTNPYWQEEIEIGPGPPKRRGGKRKDSVMNRTGTAMSASTVDSKRSTSTRTAGNSMEAVAEMGVAVVDSVRTSLDTLGENWNRRRYQREDEELWGRRETPDSRMGPIRQQSIAGSSIGMPGTSRPGTSNSTTENYYIAKAPPVNDLHPPIVSLLSSNHDQSRWMLQPPPKAAVQMGRERPRARSRSGSGASSKVSLHRQVSERRLGQQMQIVESSDLPIPALIAFNGPYRSLKGRRFGQKATGSAASIESSGTLPAKATLIERRKMRRSRLAADATDSSSSSETAVSTPSRSPQLRPIDSTHVKPGLPQAYRARPNLSTIVSQDSGISRLPPSPTRDDRRQENAGPSPSLTSPSPSLDVASPPTPCSAEKDPSVGVKHDVRSKKDPLMLSDKSSLNVLRDLVQESPLRKSKWVGSAVPEARVRLPPVDPMETFLLSDEGWDRVDVSKRWSVDF